MGFRFLAAALVVLLFIAPASADAGLPNAEADARDCGGRIDWGCAHPGGGPAGYCVLYLDPHGTGDGVCAIY